ncbi:MAG TPA: HemK2/MTQ2 family protein methyltransferase [Solirubrobacteraceae bacterium]|nr:HemK2/MTQ2 family protein methyltransferase [Solirubrobacteraceae bacterium]
MSVGVAPPPLRIVAPPGVFTPHSDTWLLAEVMRERGLACGGDVLDLCSGSGALGVAAARAGARSVTAVDVSRRAVLSARLNARLNGVRVHALRGNLFEPVSDRRFDLILSNPPYVPSDSEQLPQRGLGRAWEAGGDGRALLERICSDAPGHLRPGASLLLVHSSVCNTQRTVQALERRGLRVAVLERRRGPLGPLLSARAARLEAAGLLGADEREEELVVIRGQRPG